MSAFTNNVIQMINKWLEKLEWKHFKNYTHFDIKNKFKDSQEKLNFLENLLCVKNILKHNFWPLIRFNIKEKKFTLIKNELPNNEDYYNMEYQYDEKHFYWEKKKLRPITYASHKDSYIYSYYSFLLWIKYDLFLKEKSLEKNILAYRNVPISKLSNVWKNNIYFAMDSFKDIVKMKDSIVMAFDISGFFDTLDHLLLKKELIKVLWWTELSKDWYKLFRNLTKFSYIEKDDIDDNNLIINIWKYHKRIDIGKFNLLRKEFKKEWKVLIKSNPKYPENNPKNPEKKNIWIPQWTPISWMLANVYMSQFDVILKKYLFNLNWKYYRYSDDILLIIPFNKKEKYLDFIEKVSNFVLKEIKNNLKLKINNKKTEISIFSNWKILTNVEYNNKDKKFIFKLEKHIQWFQYLGFTFDWDKVLLRNKTLSNYYKKLIQTLKRVYHLLDTNKFWWTKFKTNKILLGKYNRKYLFNWNIIWKQYKKIENKWVIEDESKWYYLWFLSYWYNAYNLFEDNFCKKYNIKNWIKKQLSWHKKVYNNLLKKYWIK